MMLLLNNKCLELTDRFKVSSNFSDYSNYYEMYLQEQALLDQKTGKCVTHILAEIDIHKNIKKIIGYVTLSTSILKLSERKNDFMEYPAIKIDFLAVDAKFEKRGFGTLLLNHTLWVANNLRINFAGVEYIVVCADANAIEFYKKYGFKKSENLRKKLTKRNFNLNMYLKLPSLN